MRLDALDSPLLNDNDITGAQQVLLKIVTGGGDDEIKMSELFKIKNKIQEAAGRNVNIIEGIGIDPELGSAVSVTVVATGFEEKRKPKEPQTVVLGDEKLQENFTVNKVADEVVTPESTPDLDFSDSFQQSLALEDEEYNEPAIDEPITADEPTAEFMSFEMPQAVEATSQVTEEKKIVFELNIDEQEESAEQVVTAIMEDESPVEMKTVVLDLIEEDEVIPEPVTLNTVESAPVNTEVIKVEARERESRLRAISQQLRTPSGLTNLEDIPAYKRNNINLVENAHSSETEIATYTLSDGKNNTTELKQNNSFLHDNVD